MTILFAFIKNPNLHLLTSISIAILLTLSPTFSFSQQNEFQIQELNTIYVNSLNNIASNDYNKYLLKKINNPTPTIKSVFSLNYHADSISSQLSRIQNEIPLTANYYTERYIRFYSLNQYYKTVMLFSFLDLYSNTISKAINDQNLPEELKLFPAVCSAFNPQSENTTGGTGYWHLNYPQAIKYGLKVTDLVDERKDLEKSSQAATNYLKDLYQHYQNWELALAAYTCGPANISKAFKITGDTTFWEIYHYLPKGNRDIVPAFIALNYVYNYGTYNPIKMTLSVNTDSVSIERKLHYKALLKSIKMDAAELIFLNPTINQNIFPDNYVALFPTGHKENFLNLKDTIYYYQDSVLLKPKPLPKAPKIVIPKEGAEIVYKVKSGDVLGSIAQRYHVRVSEIQYWNNLRGTRIDVGQKLVIYAKGTVKKRGANSPQKKETTKQSNKQATTTTPPTSNKGYITYTVKSGDNLWLIAQKYKGVSPDNIMELNGISEDLQPGQILKIKKK